MVNRTGANSELERVFKQAGTVGTYLQDAAEVAKRATDQSSLIRALDQAAPWAKTVVDAASESLPPLNFLLKVLSEITGTLEPNDLGCLACTAAYQRAVQQAVTEVLGLEPPTHKKISSYICRAGASAHDFTCFSMEAPSEHSFIREANQNLEEFAAALGFDGHWSTRLQRETQARFIPNLKGILCHGKTRDRFAPFREMLSLGTQGNIVHRALLDHADSQRWLFEECAVLGNEAFSLAEVYEEPECSLLRWDDVGTEMGRRDPFGRQIERRPLLHTVTTILGDRDYKGVLILQGPAGSGKSSFTLRLCAEMVRCGLSPVRVELKNLDCSQGVGLLDALVRAIEIHSPRRSPNEKHFLSRGPNYDEELLRLFDQSITFRGFCFCPYILILDGWDELPQSGGHNFADRLGSFLRDLEEAFLRRRSVAVRVILVGRPSEALAQSNILKPDTRVISIQPWTVENFKCYVSKVQGAQCRRRVLDCKLGVVPSSTWTVPSQETLHALGRRFHVHENVDGAHVHSTPVEYGHFNILESPLIAHLCLRLVGEAEHRSASNTATHSVTHLKSLVHDSTSLFRHVVDAVIEKAGKAPSVDFEPGDAPVIAGRDLRFLLQRIAEIMSVLGRENVARGEVLHRLNSPAEEIEKKLERLEGSERLSRLMISFFFKGGHDALGCEFSHTSFREYLFAERIVELLKECGRRIGGKALPERDGDILWKDFAEEDPRRALGLKLAVVLGPQWLTPEVTNHLEGLLRWEITRATGRPTTGDKEHLPTQLKGLPSDECDYPAWYSIRNALADLWDWWCEGVHLRSQPYREYGERMYKWHDPVALNVIRDARFLADSSTLQPAIATATVDAHLGDGLFSLTALIHAIFIEAGCSALEVASPTGNVGLRRYQRGSPEQPRFAPSGPSRGNFSRCCHRVNAVRLRPLGSFPCGAYLRRVNLASTFLGGVEFRGSNLSGTDLSKANLNGADLSGANLSGADLSQAYLCGANLSGAWLGGAVLHCANLSRADLTGAYLLGAELHDAALYCADSRGARVTDQQLSQARPGGFVPFT